jgi:hypothetical protein
MLACQLCVARQHQLQERHGIVGCEIPLEFGRVQTLQPVLMLLRSNHCRLELESGFFFFSTRVPAIAAGTTRITAGDLDSNQLAVLLHDQLAATKSHSFNLFSGFVDCASQHSVGPGGQHLGRAAGEAAGPKHPQGM